MIKRITPFVWQQAVKPILAGLALGLTLLAVQNAWANPAQPIENMEEETAICARAIQAQERRRGIPKGLLEAISLAESGRWDAENKENLAWPWTVTTGGKGYFLPNRVDAVAFVLALQANGVKNIDVGCMQVNLMYHPDAFASIEDAFEPDTNAAYAADLLSGLFANSRSWIQAAGDYHSTTPERHHAYRAKVAKLWHATARNTAKTHVAQNAAPRDTTQNTTQGAPVQTTPKSKIAPPAAQSFAVALAAPRQIDYARTQRINEAFRNQRSGGVISGPGLAIANRVNALKPGARQGGPDRFAQNRQAQILAWRQTQGDALPASAAGF